jgi:hypothetical protein
METDILRIRFQGNPRKKMQLKEPKQEYLLAVLHKWIQVAHKSTAGGVVCRI